MQYTNVYSDEETSRQNTAFREIMPWLQALSGMICRKNQLGAVED